ncbi:Trm112 family protein [Henriciella sp. AS95]|uniref:Trm112 family protein n=1 Tax=Henriciella sp. AS95 TaxID=3135782 RepID=UPI00317E477E
MTEDHAPSEDSPHKTDPRLLELLICPVTRQPLTYDKDAQELISQKARLAYPIRDGLPIMLESEARSLDED